MFLWSSSAGPLFSVPDKKWFRAEDHVGILRDFMSSMASMDFGEEVHCLDLFGASGRIAGAFAQAATKRLVSTSKSIHCMISPKSQG